MRPVVRACLNATLVVTSVIASILLVELGLRLVGYTALTRTIDHSDYPRFYFKADPVNGFDNAENFPETPFDLPDYSRSYGAPFTVSSNNVGCRDRSFDREDGYALLLGDSFTWAYAPFEHTWGAILEQLIGIRVLNCGVSGYGPRQERHKLETVVAQAGRPRVVIVGYYVGNDLVDDYLDPGSTVVDGYMVTKVTLAEATRGERKVYSGDELQARLRTFMEQKTAGSAAGMKDVLARHSVLYDRVRKSKALRDFAAQIGLADPPPAAVVQAVFHSVEEYPWLHQAWEDHLTNLRQLRSSVKAVGATLLVVLIPTSDQVYEFLRSQEGGLQWEYPNTRLAEFFNNEDIAFLDLLPEFKQNARHKLIPLLDAQEDLYWPHDIHLNVTGNRLAGLLVAQRLLQNPSLRLPEEEARLSTVRKRMAELARTSRTSTHPSVDLN